MNAHLIDVTLLEVPIALRERAQQHGDELLREMTLIALRQEATGDTLPTRLTRLAAEMQDNYGAFVSRPDAEIEAAAGRGEEWAQVVYTVPVTVGPFAAHILELLEEAEEFCRDGSYLLSLAAPPDVYAYRAWALLEFERQARGLPPIPWPEYAAVAGLT